MLTSYSSHRTLHKGCEQRAAFSRLLLQNRNTHARYLPWKPTLRMRAITQRHTCIYTMAENVDLPQKRFYRQRAHSNPLADHTFSYPARPDLMDWRTLFSAWEQGKAVRFLDVGCGYGGLLVRLSELYPDTLVLGVEIRVKVSDYIQDRLTALRQKHPGSYGNAAVLRTNAMKYLPNYLEKGQLRKMFFLFPDPHFKKTKHKWRIVNSLILAEYAYLMEKGGIVYTGT